MVEGGWESGERRRKNACIKYGAVGGVKRKESTHAQGESEY